MNSPAPRDARPNLFAVELRTARWDAMVAWYRDRLGFRCLVRVVDDRYALLEAGGTRLALLGRDPTETASTRWSLAIEVKDLIATIDQLGEPGLVGSLHQNPEGFTEVAVTDPDGNRLKLFAWNDSFPPGAE